MSYFFLSVDFNLKFSKELVRDWNWNQRFLYEKMFLFASLFNVYLQYQILTLSVNTFFYFQDTNAITPSPDLIRCFGQIIIDYVFYSRYTSCTNSRQQNNTKSTYDIQLFFIALSDILVWLVLFKKKTFPQ